MKKFSKALVTLFACSALAFTACSKKPVRTGEIAPQTGPDNSGVNPDQVAVPTVSDQAPGTGLSNRDNVDANGQMRNLAGVDPVYFSFDRSAVDQKERAKIDAAVKWMKDNPDKRMLLEGHCDWRGTAEYNLGLGDRRAGAVRKYMETLGIDTKRLEILSKGSIDANKQGTASDWAKDRRVDFVGLAK